MPDETRRKQREAIFDKLKSCDAKQLASIISDAYASNHLAIVNMWGDSEEAYTIHIAFWLAIRMLENIETKDTLNE